MIVDANLSTHQYNLVREKARIVDSQMYPSYYKVQAATRLCHPDDIRVSETYAEVKLQSLMDHTVTRLCKAQEEVIKAVNNLKTINIIVKWGCDGAEQNYYKQKLYCRPIKFVFAKETRDLIKGEV